MSKAFRFIQNYLIYAFPFVIIFMVWRTVNPEIGILKDVSFATRIVSEIFSWNLMVWFVVLILFLVLLLVWTEAREKVIKRLANIKERDEREEYITGKASRAAYISTLSLIIFFLFFSIFSLNIYRIPENEVMNGKTSLVSISLDFNLLDKPKLETSSFSGQVILESKDLIPLSKTGILFILLVWQLVSFNFTARKENFISNLTK